MAVLQYPGAPLGSTPIIRTNPVGGQYISGYASPSDQASIAKGAGNTAGSYAAGVLGATIPATTSALSGIQSAFGLGGTGTGTGVAGTGTGTGSGPVSAGGGVAPMAVPNLTASNAAQYATAKDQVGASSRAALNSLRDELGATGQLGGGAEAAGTEKAIMSAAGDLGQVSRDQATNAANLAEDVAKTNYEGQLQQREQDINAQEANARLALESRQQYMSLLQSALAGIGSLGGGSSSGGGSGMAGLLY